MLWAVLGCSFVLCRRIVGIHHDNCSSAHTSGHCLSLIAFCEEISESPKASSPLTLGHMAVVEPCAITCTLLQECAIRRVV